MFKTLRNGLVLAGVIGAPYVWSQVPQLRTWAEQIHSTLTSSVARSDSTGSNFLDSIGLTDGSAASDAGEAAGGSATAAPATPPPTAPVTPALVGGGMQDIRQALRFDIDPRWVTEHWSHVETFAAERNLLGMRVPIMTGTEPHDLAGSLTYYFDTRHRLQRVVLRGRTGDERPLVKFVEEAFGLRAEPAIAAGLYIARWNGQPHNLLYSRFAPLVRSDIPHSRLDIWLEVNQLDIGVQLSSDSQAILTHLHQASGLAES